MNQIVTVLELQDLTGVTYRQLDYWSREGWLPDIPRTTGSGQRRHFTARTVAAVRILVQLGDLGVLPGSPLATAALNALDAGQPTVTLGPITINLKEPR